MNDKILRALNMLPCACSMGVKCTRCEGVSEVTQLRRDLEAADELLASRTVQVDGLSKALEAANQYAEKAEKSFVRVKILIEAAMHWLRDDTHEQGIDLRYKQELRRQVVALIAEQQEVKPCQK